MHKSIEHVLIYVSAIIHNGKRTNLSEGVRTNVCMCVCAWKHGAISPWRKNCQFWYVQVCTNADRWLNSVHVLVFKPTFSSIQTVPIEFLGNIRINKYSKTTTKVHVCLYFLICIHAQNRAFISYTKNKNHINQPDSYRS